VSVWVVRFSTIFGGCYLPN